MHKQAELLLSYRNHYQIEAACVLYVDTHKQEKVHVTWIFYFVLNDSNCDKKHKA